MFYIRVLILILSSSVLNEVSANICDSFIVSNHFNKNEIDEEIEFLKNSFNKIKPKYKF